MLSKLPLNLDKVNKENINKQILRLGIIAELDAISFYEQLAAMTDKEDIKKVLLDVTAEEKEHVGEFETLLLREDKEQAEKGKEGKKEVEELTGK